jgi:DNA repair exonuclease SbcCD ATPase subunit
MFICDKCLLAHYEPVATAMLTPPPMGTKCEACGSVDFVYNIHHLLIKPKEVVVAQASTQEIALTDWKDIEIQKFSNTIDPQTLQTLANQYAGLKIKDHTDKEGFDKVYAGRQTLKKKRVFIEKEGKKLRDQVNSFKEMVTAKEGELVSILRVVEDELQQEEDNYEAAREKIRLAEKKKEDDRIQAMIDKLNAVGAAVDFATLKGFTDEQFQEYLSDATRQHTEAEELKVQAEEAEEKRKADALAELKRQQESIRQENERLSAIKAEQDKQAAELKAAQEKLNQEKLELESIKNKAIQDEKNRIQKIADDRTAALNQYKFFTIPETIGDLPQADFDELLAGAKSDFEIQEAKEKKEREEEELRAMEDSERFAFLSQQIDIQFLKSSVWTNFKSKGGKISAFTLKQKIQDCKELCDKNAKK